MPKLRYAGRVLDENGFYADPRLWFYAERKVFKGGYWEAEFQLYWDGLGSDSIPAAIETAVDPPTDETMGDDEVSMAVVADTAIDEPGAAISPGAIVVTANSAATIEN